MRILIIDDVYCEETKEIINLLPYAEISDLEHQENFDCIYSPFPRLLINEKLKIPYFYNVEDFTNFQNFSDFHSKIQGANAVFVNDRQLNRYSEWADLNSYWINKGIDCQKYYYLPRKYFTPKLNIGIILTSDKETIDLFSDIFKEKKSNWNFYIKYSNKEVPICGDSFDVNSKEEIFERCHIFLDLTRESFPNQNCLEAMARGCVVVSLNLSNNNNHIIFDEVHYFKLNISPIEILQSLRSLDKRREKLSRVSLQGSVLVRKYFNIKNIIKQKIDIMKQEI